MTDDCVDRARQVLLKMGFDPTVTLVRADSYANEVWLGPGFVLRINHRGDVGRLQREARVIESLPPEAAHPGILDCGTDGVIEWSLARRVPGAQLSRAWPSMAHEERIRAARQLALALQAVHATVPPAALGEIAPPHTLPLEPLLGLIDAVSAHCRADASLFDAVRAFVLAHWSAFDHRNTGLVHGDPHLENILWDGERLTLLDFEWSRPSWIECDLEILAAFFDHPWRFVGRDYAHRVTAAEYSAVLAIFRSVYPRWFAHPRMRERLAVLHISRVLGFLHEEPPTQPHQAGDPNDRRSQLVAVLNGIDLLGTLDLDL